MLLIEKLTNTNSSDLKYLIKKFANLTFENIEQIFVIKNKIMNHNLNICEFAAFIKAIEFDQNVKKRFQAKNYKGLESFEIAEISQYNAKIKYEKKTRIAKKTYALRLHKQALLDASTEMSLSELANFAKRITGMEISRGTIYNFMKRTQNG